MKFFAVIDFKGLSENQRHHVAFTIFHITDFNFEKSIELLEKNSAKKFFELAQRKWYWKGRPFVVPQKASENDETDGLRPFLNVVSCFW